MRRIMLSALLAPLALLALLALSPTAALASSIDVSDPHPGPFVTGTFDRGTLNRGVAGGLSGTLSAILLGSSTEFRIGGTAIGTGCGSPVGNTCTLTGGTLTIRNPALTMVLFTASISTGTVTNTATSAKIFVNFVPNSCTPGCPQGGFATLNLIYSGTGPITGGNGSANVIPEPGTIGLLGTGLIGLAGMVRRKLRT